MTEKQTTLEELFPPVKASFMKRHDKNGYYITSNDLAELLKVNHKSIKSLINNNFDDLAQLTPLNAIRFNQRKYLHGGRPENNYYLTEEQAALLIMLSRPNTASVKAKMEIAKLISQTRKNYQKLHEITELLLKQATGLTAGQIKKQRNVNNSLDGLTVKEQERYDQLENIAISFIKLNKTSDELKGILLLA